MEHIVEIPDSIKSKEKADPFSLDYGWPVREEVVRCRDCEKFRIAAHTPLCIKFRRATDPNGFCWQGERHG